VSQRPTLVLLYAPDPSAHPGDLRVELTRGETVTVGRSPETDMTIPDPRTSRIHAEIRWEQDRVVVNDLSQNGTSIDGARFESGEVVDGDVVRFGDSFVILRFEADPPEDDADVPEINGIGPAMRAVRREVVAASGTSGAVRIGGAPGVGKRAVARVIHRRSGRSGELVVVDAAAGDLEEALTSTGGGTLYVANVEALSPALNEAIVGAGPARIMVGTRGSFDSGGAFAHEITIPPIRTRREDILPYVLRVVGRPAVDLDPELAAGLLRHLWPYNVRELSKVAQALAERGEGKPKLSLDLIRDGLAFIGGSADETLPATHIQLDD